MLILLSPLVSREFSFVFLRIYIIFHYGDFEYTIPILNQLLIIGELNELIKFLLRYERLKYQQSLLYYLFDSPFHSH